MKGIPEPPGEVRKKHDLCRWKNLQNLPQYWPHVFPISLSVVWWHVGRRTDVSIQSIKSASLCAFVKPAHFNPSMSLEFYQASSLTIDHSIVLLIVGRELHCGAVVHNNTYLSDKVIVKNKGKFEFKNVTRTIGANKVSNIVAMNYSGSDMILLSKTEKL